MKHSYAFCWRSQTPLLNMAVPSWFMKVGKYELDQTIEYYIAKVNVNEPNNEINQVNEIHMLKSETNLINAGPADEGEAALSQRGDLLGKT